ncbi:bestrophin-like domain [Paraburkholderia saeva]|uniref:DUF4239 domain-containing protein n=1 Tax=Paraburkholderia saeva TaxID=2777537 RepID=A0A9N8RTG1_9BURK|nr:hypothetical protein [Paraburkholderia saeva]CAG4889773.1 hypothetical protein LMG31841_00891 [Paraburkholderia saeva]
MAAFVDHPAILFVVLLAVFVAASALGAFVSRHVAPLPDDAREDFNVVQTSTLTLLALLIGFSLSMAVNRYDQRKNLEENEANAIGTEYVRADLIDAQTRIAMKAALVRYTQLRLDDYKTRDSNDLARINRDTAGLQSELWRLAAQVAGDKPTPVAAIVATGMNDVLNSQDYSEAARINHIPIGAWILMILIAVFGCAVQGYGAKGGARRGLFTILPVTVALSLALIADIDSPRGGIIHVQPQNLSRLLQSLQK